MAGLVAILVGSSLLLPVGQARAADGPLPAPVLITPVGGSALLEDIELRWERVPEATGYRLQVFSGDASGYPLLDVQTVNDRWHDRLLQTTGTIWWQVQSIGTWGPGGTAHATFTALPTIPTSLWPPDAATIVHPIDTPVLAWEGAYEWGATSMTQDPTSAEPPPLGTWSWRPVPDAVRSGLPAPPPGESRTYTYTWPDSVPGGLAPADGAHLPGGTAAQLSWAAVNGAAAYNWELRRSNGDIANQGVGTMATWADLPASLAPGSYTWRVRAQLAGSEWPDRVFGAWSVARTLTIDPEPQPSAVAPADGASLDAWPMLRWTPVEGAGSYRVQVAAAPADSGTWRWTSLPAFSFDAAAGGTGPYEAAAGSITRWWRVATGSGWSPWRSFTVTTAAPDLATPEAAPLLAPADCQDPGCPPTPGMPVFRWSPVAGSLRYRVFIAWTGDAGEGVHTYDTASTAFAPDQAELPPGDLTAWAVVACPNALDCPTAMPDARWHVRIALPAPTLTSPADGSTIEGPAALLTWGMPALPDDVLLPPVNYTLTRSTSLNGTVLPRGTEDLRTHTFSTYEGMGHGMTLTWSVTARTAGLKSVSAPSSYTRSEPALVPTGPDPDVPQSSLPIFSWEPLDYPVYRYTVELSRDLEASSQGNYFPTWNLPAAGTAVRPSFPLAPGAYTWRVRRVASQYGNETDGPVTEGSFTVAGDPQIHLLSPAAGASVPADAVVLDWTPLDGVNLQSLAYRGYIVLIGSTPDLTWDTANYRYYAFADGFAVPNQLPEGVLYWRTCAAYSCSDVGTLDTGVSDVRSLFVTQATVADRAAPVVVGSPTLSFAPAGSVTALPVRLRATWSATDLGTGVHHHTIQIIRDGVVVATRQQPEPELVVAATAGHTWAVRVRPVDRAGNAGTWATSPGRTLVARQDRNASVRWSDGWRRRSGSAWWGGTARTSRTAGASVATTVVGRGIALIAPVGPNRGSVRILVDGVRVATVSLRAPESGMRRVVWSRTWAAPGSHRIVIRVIGAAGQHPVAVDGFVILR